MADRTPSTEQFLEATVAFGILRRFDRHIRTETSLDSFRWRMKRQLREQDIPPLDPKVVELLYERAVDAKGDITWIRDLAQLRRSTEWRAHQSGLQATVVAAATLRKSAKTIDKSFSPKDLTMMIADLERRLRCVTAKLDEVRRWNQRMEQLASRSNWNDVLRSLRTRIARTLKQQCPNMSKDQTVAIIKAVVEAMQIKEEESTEAILKTLQRHLK